MTPDDLAAIPTPERIRRNCMSNQEAELVADALEQAWALADSRREEANRWAAKFGQEQARAELAEAERDDSREEEWRIRELYEREQQAAWRLVGERARALEALARVRALCDEAREWGKGNPEVLFFEQDIRAAIEEDQ